MHAAVLIAALLLSGAGSTRTLLVVDEIPGLPEAGGRDLEGITLGQPLSEVEDLLDLRGLTPQPHGQGSRYTWYPPYRFDPPQSVVEGSALRRLDLIVRDEHIHAVRAAYVSEVVFTRMGGELTHRYGEPVVVKAGPPREITSAGGEKQFLWIQIWRWEWEGVVFTVTGEHYTEEKDRLAGGTHFFHFWLESVDEP